MFKYRRLSITLVAAVVLVVGCTHVAHNAIPDASEAKRWLVEHVQIGTTRAAAVAYLKSHKLNGTYPLHSDYRYHSVPAAVCVSFGADNCTFNGGRDGLYRYNSPRTLIVEVPTPDADRKFVWCDLRLFVGFDQHGRVDSRKASQSALDHSPWNQAVLVAQMSWFTPEVI